MISSSENRLETGALMRGRIAGAGWGTGRREERGYIALGQKPSENQSMGLGLNTNPRKFT